MLDVLIIGAGQAGLATAWYLRRTPLRFLLLDAEVQPGGAWPHTWNSLRLFSPAQFSSLPGWPMPPSRQGEGFPQRDEVIDYLRRYEERYAFPIERPVHVRSVGAQADCLVVSDGQREWRARAVVSATGTWGNPFIPHYPGQEQFQGLQLHSAAYRSPEPFRGQRVLVVGGGNSGAQIQAELAEVAEASWVTREEPVFLPDDVDGRVLFQRASARVLGKESSEGGIGGIGDIVVVPPVRRARERGALRTRRPFTRFTPTGVIWPEGDEERIDALLWCTGFRPVLEHLGDLGVLTAEGRVDTQNNQSTIEPRLWLIGYGDWTGAASATLIGAGRVAREMLPRLRDFLSKDG